MWFVNLDFARAVMTSVSDAKSHVRSVRYKLAVRLEFCVLEIIAPVFSLLTVQLVALDAK